ncbi:NAD(P)H-dependent oxidoreductase subunit E, partial [bacterium]|nr:NAD(P)H-dependent oxidoreductase subunit E [bacterium]MBU1599269.1 NAD(P)H-dependent oxidoreductase subunit E [bacterium]
MDRLDEIIEKYKDTEGGLIPALQETQEAFGYLKREDLIKIGNGLKIPFSQVYGVVTFYSQFFLTPKGRHTIRVCRGTACHVQGAKKIISAVSKVTGLTEGKTPPPNSKFTLETVACVGVCALSPVMMINDSYFGKMTPK